VLKTLERTDAFRRAERFEDFLLSCTADSRGRAGLEDTLYEQADYFRDALKAALAVEIKEFVADGLEGKALAEKIREIRVKEISRIMEKNPDFL
jgi:tRNA nucleotidyltransferase (CCA-adding enzyme)